MRLPDGPRQPAALQVARWAFRPLPFLEECARDHGDAFTLRFPRFPPMVMVSSPEAVRQVFTGSPDVMHAGEANQILGPAVGRSSLLLLDGKEHLRQRRLLLPPLHGERMQLYGEVMREATSRVMAGFPVGAPFPLLGAMQEITLEVIARTVFGTGEHRAARGLLPAIARAVEVGQSPLLFFPGLQREFFGLGPWRRIKARLGAVDRELYAEIHRRRAEGTGARRDDILSLLLDARDEAGCPMTDEELRDELVTLLLAGHETTATTLAWAFQLVLSHPAVYARLLAELSEVAGDGPLEAQVLPRLPYLDAVIKETLRLRPIIPIVVRVLKQETRVGEHLLPAGVSVAPCIYLTHRRPDLYPHPEVFRPERFLDARNDPYAYLPFGGGARRCIGMAFSLYESKIVLGEILRAARLRLAPGYHARVARRGVALAPSGGTLVVLDERPSPLPAARETRSRVEQPAA